MRIRAATPGLLAVMMSGGCSSSGVLGISAIRSAAPC